MPTLRIEHEITDYEVWKNAFDRFGDFRRQGGVLRYRVQRPLDDARRIVIDLDFETADRAETFLDALRTKVWSSREAAPALVGTPTAVIVDLVEEGRPNG
ncbi:hypothetical protein [Streptomyces sp. NPDC015131]|uniref:hypothetical protein n=1 Tax=Streptomyces sp. NPDC015131 TaxID=3364941 RepID=UPI0037008CC5